MRGPRRVGRDESTWAQYAERTAGREPLEFFRLGLEVSDGEVGNGRLVVDLGSGAGNETIGFLRRGWRVHSVDASEQAMEVLLSRVPEELRPHLTHEVARFHEADLPSADLVFASLSLPFAGKDLEASVRSATGAVRPGGWFVGVLFGHNDTWAPDGDVAAVDRSDIVRFLAGFEPVHIEEEEFDGPSGAGPKHWHWFVVSARRPT